MCCLGRAIRRLSGQRSAIVKQWWQGEEEEEEEVTK
jgi:hypothetical protein